jgi:hypothetical protein
VIYDVAGEPHDAASWSIVVPAGVNGIVLPFVSTEEDDHRSAHVSVWTLRCELLGDLSFDPRSEAVVISESGVLNGPLPSPRPEKYTGALEEVRC